MPWSDTNNREAQVDAQMTEEQEATIRTEIQKGFQTPLRLAWHRAFETGDLSLIKTLWFESYDRFYHRNVAEDKFIRDSLERSELWLLRPFHDDRIFLRGLHDRSNTVSEFKWNFVVGLDPMFLACPLEVALRKGNRNLLDDIFALLNDGKYYRLGGDLAKCWTLAVRMFDCNFTKLSFNVGLRVDDLSNVLGDIFGLAFLMEDDYAYTELIRAGFDDANFVDAAHVLMLQCRDSKPLAFDEINKMIAQLGYSCKTMDEWFKFIDSRYDANTKLDNALSSYRVAADDLKPQAMETVEAILLSCAPSITGTILEEATAAEDIALVRRLFEAGGHPNSTIGVDYPRLTDLCSKMSVEMFRVWLDAGANPMLLDAQARYESNQDRSPLRECVQAGRAELVKLCLFNAKKPVEIEWTQQYEDDHIESFNPLTFLAEQAQREALDWPQRAAEFATIALMLSNEADSQRSAKFAEEMDVEIRQGSSGDDTGRLRV